MHHTTQENSYKAHKTLFEQIRKNISGSHFPVFYLTPALFSSDFIPFAHKEILEGMYLLLSWFSVADIIPY